MILEKLLKQRARFVPARVDPLGELEDVHAAVAGFAVVDPRLRLAEFRAQLTLGQLSLIAKLTQPAPERFVVPIVLGFCRHMQKITDVLLDTSSVSGTVPVFEHE